MHPCTIRSVYGRRLFFAGLLCLFMTTAGCAKPDQVLESHYLDLLPALVQATQGEQGYSLEDVLLVLVPAEKDKVRITRATAKVLAFWTTKNGWSAPGEGLAIELSAIDYRFRSPEELEQVGFFLPSDQGASLTLNDPRSGLQWFRAGVAGNRLNLEVCFQTLPRTIRKATYQADERGLAAVLDSGALLKIK